MHGAVLHTLGVPRYEEFPEPVANNDSDVPHVLRELLEPPPTRRFSCCLAVHGRIAEGAARCQPCFVRLHAARDESLRLAIEMIAQLLVDAVVCPRRTTAARRTMRRRREPSMSLL